MDNISNEPKNFKEGEFEDILYRTGKLEAFKKLDPKLQGPVKEAAITLRSVDTQGKNVEFSDKNILKGSKESTQPVNENFYSKITGELGEVDREYRKNNGDWFEASLNGLIDGAASGDDKKLVDGTMYMPDHYLVRLRQSGDYYSKLLDSTYPSTERVEMNDYVKKMRPQLLDKMGSTVHRDLADRLAHISEVRRQIASNK